MNRLPPFLLAALLIGCATPQSPEVLAEQRVEKLHKDCEVLSGELVLPIRGPKFKAYQLHIVLITEDKVVWAVARNREKSEILTWLAEALKTALEEKKPDVSICGSWIIDDYFEMVRAYDFQFTDITFWWSDASRAGGRYAIVRTNYGDRIKDEIKENWWSWIKGSLGRIFKGAGKAAGL